MSDNQQCAPASNSCIALTAPLTLLRPAGVEHLLRNVKDATISTLATDVSSKLQALKGLRSRLGEIGAYLELVQDGKLPINHDIMTYLQVGRSDGGWERGCTGGCCCLGNISSSVH